MQLNLLLEKTRSFIDSLLFPLLIGLLATLIWFVPGNYSWIPSIIYSALSFLPLVATDGKAYMPLMLFTTIICSERVSFTTIPTYLYVIAASIFVSEVIFIILKKPKLVRGDIMIPFAILFGVFFVSYIYNSIQEGHASSYGVLFILALFLLLLLYVVFSTVLGRGESLSYFCKTYVCLAFFISIEILIYQARHEFGFINANFDLGWSYTPPTSSTLLCLSLPFFGILIFKKQFFYIIPEIFVIYTIIILSTDSGLLCLILGIIPLILLSFKTYGKYYPYISLACIVTIATAFAILLAVNDRFNNRVLLAVQSLNLIEPSSPMRADLFNKTVEQFLSNPVIGTSISSLLTADGTVLLSSNTVLSVMAMGGSLGLAAFLYLEIKIYFCCLKKQTSDKYLFLVFLLLFELIGLIDNTMFNLIILLLFLTANSCYQMSNRPDEVLVHDGYYQYLREQKY